MSRLESVRYTLMKCVFYLGYLVYPNIMLVVLEVEK